jgi:TM2 domain-containing membrane protein YozV
MENKDWKLNRSVACVLAFLFGGFGAHWFYVGRTKRGILHFLFFWTFIPTFMSFIDIITWVSMDEHRWHEIYEGSYHLDR